MYKRQLLILASLSLVVLIRAVTVLMIEVVDNLSFHIVGTTEEVIPVLALECEFDTALVVDVIIRDRSLGRHAGTGTHLIEIIERGSVGSRRGIAEDGFSEVKIYLGETHHVGVDTVGLLVADAIVIILAKHVLLDMATFLVGSIVNLGHADSVTAILLVVIGIEITIGSDGVVTAVSLLRLIGAHKVK